MSKQIVINLLGEPSCGKSTAAAYIFSKLKMNGISCEYVSEFAKDKVYEDNSIVFKYQGYIFGKQSFKLDRVAGKVDVIVTDSPLILSALYNTDTTLGKHFNDMVISKFNSYDNYNYLLNRRHSYEDKGRLQDETQSKEIKLRLKEFLVEHDISFTEIDSSNENYDMIVDEIKRMVQNEQ